MSRVIDLTGLKFGKWTVVNRSNREGSTYWNCICDCGACKEVMGRHLRSGKTKSCGKCKKYVIRYNIVTVYVKESSFEVDICDLDLVEKYKYNIRNDKYVIRGSETRYLHRDIMEKILNRKLTFDEKVDHIDRNPSNNRRSNLRLVTNQENSFNQGIRTDNTSGIRGVYWSNKSHWWCANIVINGKTKYLGHFKTKEDAERARLLAESKHFTIKNKKNG